MCRVHPFQVVNLKNLGMSTSRYIRKIAIVEFYEHSEVLSYLSGVLAGAVELTVFSSLKIYKDAGLQKEVFVEIDCTKISKTLKSLLPVLEKFDGIIVLTTMVDHRPWLLLEQLQIPKAVFVHNANWMFGDSLSYLPITLSRLLKRLKWSFQGSMRHRLNVAEQFDAFIFPSSEIAAGFRDKTKGHVFGINWAVSSLFSKLGSDESKGELISLVVPGTVDFQARAYEVLAKALALCTQEELACFELVLLGTASSKEAQNLVKSLNKFSIHLFSTTRFVPVNEYEQRLSSADVILNLQREKVGFATTIEIPGLTKMSGVVHDAIRHAKRMWVFKGSRVRKTDMAFESAKELARLIKQHRVDRMELGYDNNPSVLEQDKIEVHRTLWKEFIDAWITSAAAES